MSSPIPFVGGVKVTANVSKTPERIVELTQSSMQRVRSTKASGYEVITGACLPYYDFDFGYDSKDKQQEQSAATIQQSVDAVRSVFPNGRLYVFTANGVSKSQWKNSVHIIVRGVGYANCGKALPVVEHADQAVYKVEGKRQLFRLPYFSKEGENRPLVRYDVESKSTFTLADAQGDLEESYADWCITNIGDEKLMWSVEAPEQLMVDAGDSQQYLDKVEEIMPEYVNDKVFARASEIGGALFMYYRSIVKSNCVFCNRVHDDNNMYAYLSPDKKLFLKCKKSDKTVFVHNYGEDTDKKIIERSIDRSVIFKRYNPVMFEEKYCSDYKGLHQPLNASDDIALIANMGTGKTVMASKHALGTLYDGCQPQESAGVISFRISLAKKYKEDFEGFTCYIDEKKGNIDDKRWICQLDSLHRISNRQLDTMYIDEVSQVRRHLTATTFMRNSHYIENLQVLDHFIKTAKQLIVMDANMSSKDIEWLQQVRGKKLNVFINTAVPRKQEMLVLKNQDRVIRQAKADIAKGLKVAIAHNGGKKHHEPLRRQLGINKNVLLINSDTMEDPRVIAALADPNEEWGKYDAIIYSPSVQSGVSYTKKNVFHRIYGIFSNCTNSSGDACQMLNRIRHPIQSTTVVTIRQYPSAQTRTIKELMDIIKSQRLHLTLKEGGVDEPGYGVAGSGPFNEYSEVDFLDNKLTGDITQASIEQNIDRLNYKANFIWWQKYYGVEVKFDVADEKKTIALDTESKKERSVLTEQVKNEDAKKLCDAVDLSVEEVDALRKKLKEQQNIGNDLILSLKKFNLNSLFKPPTIPKDPEWYKTYDDKKVRNVYYNSSKYFKEGVSVDTVLEQVKESDVRRDIMARTGVADFKSTESCVVDFFLNKPRYQKEKILIGWLKDFGFDGLNSSAEVDVDMVKAKLVSVIHKIDAHCFNVLEKKPEKMRVLKAIKPDDAKFMKTGMQFINGSLKEYFNISIKKKKKHDKFYSLVNKYVEDGVLKDPVGVGEVRFAELTPVLGKVLGDDLDDEDEDEEPEAEAEPTTEERLAILKAMVVVEE
jgi:hypothetical protein